MSVAQIDRGLGLDFGMLGLWQCEHVIRLYPSLVFNLVTYWLRRICSYLPWGMKKTWPLGTLGSQPCSIREAH